MGQELYQRGLRVPVIQAPQVRAADVSSGVLKLAQDRNEMADEIDRARKASALADLQTGSAQAFRDLDEKVRAMPWDQKIQAYEDGAAQIRSQYVDSAGQEVQAAFKGDFERMYGSYQIHTRDDARKGQTSHARAQADVAADGFARDMAFARTPQEREVAKIGLAKTYSTLRAGGFIDEMEERAGVSKAMASGDMFAARKLIEDDPWKAKKAFENPENFKWLGGEQIVAFREDAARAIDRREAKQREAQAAQAAAITATLGVQINRFANGQGDDVGQESIDALKGKLTPSAWATVQKQYDDARAKRASDDGERVNVAAVIEAGGHIDPGNPKQVKAYDAYFRTSVMPELAKSADPEAAALAFVKDQGIVPETMKSSLRTSLRSGTPDQKVAAAAMVDQIKTVSPRALLDIDDETLRQANTLAAYVDAGATPAEAASRIEEAMRQSKTTGKALDAEYDALVKQGPTGDWLAAGHDESWWGAPSVPVAVAAEVGAVARNEFLRNGGDLEGARRTALDLTKKRYGVSRVNGSPQVVRNPIEQHYGVGWLTPEENAAAIKAEAVAELSEGNIEGGLTPDRVRIHPYPSKGVVTADGKPAYAIEVQDTDGIWHVQMDLDEKSPTSGQPKPWVPSLAAARQARDSVVKGSVSEVRGELPPGAFVEGATVYDAPKPVTRNVDVGNLVVPYTPTGDGGRRMIGTMVNGKFIRSQPSREKR